MNGPGSTDHKKFAAAPKWCDGCSPDNCMGCEMPHATSEGLTCSCFPGTCRGGEVVNGKLANGQRCKACIPASTVEVFPRLIEFAVARWNEEVRNRPLVNKHRRTLDDTWRQVIRFAGGDPDTLIGPSHDVLLSQSTVKPEDSPVVSQGMAILDNGFARSEWMREDMKFLRSLAGVLSYNTADAQTKHRLLEIVMRVETGFYTPNAPINTLRERLQKQCVAWNAYWRAPDEHGVKLSTEQALELLRDALGVDVVIDFIVTPIDMVLHCPACGMQHIDAPEFDGTREDPFPAFGEDPAMSWTNPPHRSHKCHGCGHVWRPADVPTNGVAAVKTKGKKDSPIPMQIPTAANKVHARGCSADEAEAIGREALSQAGVNLDNVDARAWNVLHRAVQAAYIAGQKRGLTT